MVEPIDTSKLGRIAMDYDPDMTREQLLEYVNELNVKAVREKKREKYWTVTVLYNTVIYREDADGNVAVFEVVGQGGKPKR